MQQREAMKSFPVLLDQKFCEKLFCFSLMYIVLHCTSSALFFHCLVIRVQVFLLTFMKLHLKMKPACPDHEYKYYHFLFTVIVCFIQKKNQNFAESCIRATARTVRDLHSN